MSAGTVKGGGVENDQVDSAPPAGQPVLLLGAGRGRRMGLPKLFAEHQGKTFAERILARCRETGSRVTLVSDPLHRERLEALLAALPPELLAPFPSVVKADGETDMLASVQAGLLAGPYEPGCWLWPADAPFISPGGWRRAVERVTEAPEFIWKLRAGGRTGHPIWLPSWTVRPLLAGNWPDGLRGFLAGVAPERIRILALEGEFLADVNTPRDLEALEALEAQESRERKT